MGRLERSICFADHLRWISIVFLQRCCVLSLRASLVRVFGERNGGSGRDLCCLMNGARKAPAGLEDEGCRGSARLGLVDVETRAEKDGGGEKAGRGLRCDFSWNLPADWVSPVRLLEMEDAVPAPFLAGFDGPSNSPLDRPLSQGALLPSRPLAH